MGFTFTDSRSYLFTSESVTEGHPDKLSDQISDAILDAIIARDPYARVACETCITHGLVAVMGEITTDTYVDVSHVIRDTIHGSGYTNPDYGFDWKSCGVVLSLQEQSKDIALGVDSSQEAKDKGIDESEDPDKIGAGDQGMVFSTEDGGKNWTRQETPTDRRLNALFFADPATGWAVGESGTILHTADGGATWSAQDSPTQNQLYDLARSKDGVIWAVGENGTILKNRND